jgi:hypothetical protein
MGENDDDQAAEPAPSEEDAAWLNTEVVRKDNHDDVDTKEHD